MKLSKIQELLRLVAESGVSEVEIEEDDFKLTIRQNSPQVLMQPAQYPAPPTYAQQPPPQQPQAPHPQQGPPQQAPTGGHASAGSGTAPSPTESPETVQDGASAASTSAQGTGEGGAPDAEEETVEGYEVKAPIVGTFYRAPSPDADPFVEEGDHVEEGDVLCIIEAMKLMNEIECETSGTVEEILVEDAEPVEFDQVLFIIDED